MSSLPGIANLPHGEKAKALIEAVWPFRIFRIFPEETFMTLTVLTVAPDNYLCLSGENDREFILSS